MAQYLSRGKMAQCRNLSKGSSSSRHQHTISRAISGDVSTLPTFIAQRDHINQTVVSRESTRNDLIE